MYESDHTSYILTTNQLKYTWNVFLFFKTLTQSFSNTVIKIKIFLSKKINEYLRLSNTNYEFKPRWVGRFPWCHHFHANTPMLLILLFVFYTSDSDLGVFLSFLFAYSPMNDPSSLNLFNSRSPSYSPRLSSSSSMMFFSSS